ncbi:DUF397 domain-containing protein [Streptomyces sp. UNOB3_S3]|uniref:DUF397 domain-containing protein n=1 Tax=Streptomyces sp. UNOB3_S3 TaxID=2871682 RepID=UPI001E4641D8|nr:DUF397 domain-containing protein [Streptomyces sp. UNOB3_S3]MCC3776850.1 DUF397 domain-containing protein [Streptomyces sp. UNOB3_S3]
MKWFKSSFSDTIGADCVEVATSPHAVHVRDSKLGSDDSPRISVPRASWGTFLHHPSFGVRDSSAIS